jgi:BirA family biotin operon repressor/biotin-[acetyl-CoA-carboxylase] ligase
MADGRTLESWEGERVDDLRAALRLPELLVFDTVASTNDIVKSLAERGAPAGVTAMAEHQSRGRGRRDRRWDAPSGAALLLSMLFRPASHSPADFAGTIPLRVGMAAARAIEAATGVAVRLKWPNDILSADGRKVAGILCESSLVNTGLAFTVVGIGINVLQNEAQLPSPPSIASAPNASAPNASASIAPASIAPASIAPASIAPASLQMLAGPGVAISRLTIATALLSSLFSIAALPAAALSADELAEFAQRDSLRCAEVTADGNAVGRAEGIGALGELRVRDGDAVRSIHAGTIRKV